MVYSIWRFCGNDVLWFAIKVLTFNSSVCEFVWVVVSWQLGNHFWIFLGVERLAGISLTSPIKIDNAEKKQKSGGKGTSLKDEEIFNTPESLKHHYVVVPSKLRLVTLIAFILWKTKVCALIFYNKMPTNLHTKC